MAEEVHAFQTHAIDVLQGIVGREELPKGQSQGKESKLGFSSGTESNSSMKLPIIREETKIFA